MRAIRRGTMVVVSVALLATGLGTLGSRPARAGERLIVAGDDVVLGDGSGLVYVSDEDTAYLGVQLEEETEHEEGGARVTAVVDDSPAAAAGLREGDVIVGFGGATIRGPVGLTKKIHEHKPGDRVSIRVVRDGREQDFEVELGNRSDLWTPLAPHVPGYSPEIQEKLREKLEKQRNALENYQYNLEGLGRRLGRLGGCEEGDCGYGFLGLGSLFGKPKLGVQLVEATPELREHLGGSAAVGVLVSKVLRATPAESAGVRVGDLIVSVDGEPVANTSELRNALADKTGRTFDLEVIRERRSVTLEVTIPEPEADVPTGPRARLLPAPSPPPLPGVAPPAPPLPPHPPVVV